MTERRERLIWTDLEMDGVDPEKDSILQLAMAVTELGSFEVLDTLEVVIWQPESRLELMSPFVRNMHESSGLTTRVRASSSSETDAERAALDLVRSGAGLGRASSPATRSGRTGASSRATCRSSRARCISAWST